ncbi:class F sortase [Streptomyces sp. NPDC058045]|uniref:class F sortase n=1 Tax=Streptomyces sp. NPDC058045 TaxID=3346311 RepID=UPI0036ED1EE9
MRRIGNTLIAAVTAAALGSGAWLLGTGAEGHPPPQPAPTEAAADAGRTGTAAPLRRSVPLRVRIPSIGVDAPLTGLGLTPQGSLDVPPPRDRNLAGWYRDGTVPGATGTAVIAGHVDNAQGPAVFYDLGNLRRGARVEVARRDGGTAVFTVDSVAVYDARHFPDRKVYGAAARPELRVITCGGGYSPTTGYQGNVVVFAHLTGGR